MGQRRSELKHPVAPPVLFTTPRDQRQARALPVLQRLRKLLTECPGLSLSNALLMQPPTLEREFAREELRCATRLLCEWSAFELHGDRELWLWAVHRALRTCGALSHRGGPHVTHRGVA